MSRRSGKIPIETDEGFHPLSSLRTEVENVFGRLAEGFRNLRGERRRPTADASESSEGYHMSIELPGMDSRDVDLYIEGDVLVISGEKRDEREEQDRNYYLLERSCDAFRRAFRLPGDVDRDAIKASFARGVLEVTMPRAAGASREVRKIDIEST